MADPKAEPFLLTCDIGHYRAYGAERLLHSLDSLTAEIKGVKAEDYAGMEFRLPDTVQGYFAIELE